MVEPGGAALVTGAGRGIGRGIALELARRGIDVVAGVRDPAAGASLLAQAAEEGAPGSVTVERLDVDHLDDFEPPAELSVLVNNAGVDTANRAVEDTAVDEWRRVFETNVLGLVALTARCIPALRADGGGVVCNLTSAGLLVPMPFFAPYRASKAAVSALGESLRAELAPFGVRVLEILPGPVATDMLAQSAPLPEASDDDAYHALAHRVADARGDIDAGATPVEAAAREIVDRILDDTSPLRCSCDPLGEALLAAWRSTSDEDFAAGFLDAFTPGTGTPGAGTPGTPGGGEHG